MLEGLLVAFAHDLSRWSVLALAIPILALYLLLAAGAPGRTRRGRCSGSPRASQALAVVVVILAFILNWLALLLAAIFAAIALCSCFADRG